MLLATWQHHNFITGRTFLCAPDCFNGFYILSKSIIMNINYKDF
jgi:hypothetical protein